MRMFIVMHCLLSKFLNISPSNFVVFLIILVGYCLLWYIALMSRYKKDQDRKHKLAKLHDAKYEQLHILYELAKDANISFGITYTIKEYTIKFSHELGNDSSDNIYLVVFISRNMTNCKKFTYENAYPMGTIELIRSILFDPAHFYDSIS